MNQKIIACRHRYAIIIIKVYPRPGSNRHVLKGHRILSPARLPIPPLRHPEKNPDHETGMLSGKRDSNSRPRPWQGRALPTELFPRLAFWSGKRDSNSRPRPWQGRALPTELFPLDLRCKISYFFSYVKIFFTFF